MTLKLLQDLPEVIQVKGNHKTRIVFVDNQMLPLAPSLKVANHSPDGFSWGYAGSGPSQMALAILLKFMPAPYASKYYQKLKAEYIAKWKIDKNFEETIPLKNFITDLITSP